MNKKFLLGGATLACLLFIGAGCVNKNQQNTEENSATSTAKSGVKEQRQQMQNMFTEDKFDKLSVADIVVGKSVLATGQENPDGMVVADNVILASSSTDPNEIMRSMMPAGGFASGTPEGMQPGEDSEDREEMRAKFENMTDEDREAMRAEMESRRGEMGAGGPPEGGMGGGQMGGPMGEGNGSNSNSGSETKKTGSIKMARITGEIMSVAPNNFTIKLKDGGSKIIYFSDSTGFWGIKTVNVE